MANCDNGNGQQLVEVEEEYVETDGQYIVDADGNQYYGEYVEVESEHVVYDQQEAKPNIVGAPISRARGGPYFYGASGRFGYGPPAHQQHFSAHQQNYLQQRQLRYSLPISTTSARRELGADSSAGGGGLPISGGNLASLPGFLTKPPKPPKNRRPSNKRKPCNCTKSQCLKLYCDCFANGEFCLDCNCKDCHNNLEHEAERSRAIKSSLEKNPSAFKPKIGVAVKAVGKAIDMERLHQRGCHCKRSNCLKNYCECFEAKVPCTDRCKCQACRNTEHDRHNKFKEKFSTTAGGLAQLAAAAAADSRARSGTPCSDDYASDVCAADGKMQQHQANPKTQPWFYMTEDVIEATTMCLVAQAQEYEQILSEDELERSVLKEFGRCLEQIIESAG